MTIVHFHLVVLHFPIALLIVGALLALFATARRRAGLREAARILLILGGVAAVATALSGQAAEEIVEEALPAAEAALEEHEEIGMVATYLAAALVLLELIGLRVRGAAMQWAATGLALVTAVVVAVAGFSGGKIRHDQPFESGGTPNAAFVVPAQGGELED